MQKSATINTQLALKREEERYIYQDIHALLPKDLCFSPQKYRWIESETVDLLQERVPKTVFACHYFTPSREYRTRVLRALNSLMKSIKQ